MPLFSVLALKFPFGLFFRFKFPFAQISRFKLKREIYLKGNLTRASTIKLAAADFALNLQKALFFGKL